MRPVLLTFIVARFFIEVKTIRLKFNVYSFPSFLDFSFLLSRTMTSFAGSAIAQGPTVGRIDLWSDWQPTTRQPRWLLLSGASNPPDDIAISKRRTRDAPGDRSGTFLPGVSHDLTNMQDTVLVKATFSNILMNLKLTKSDALESIRELFADCLITGKLVFC